MVGDSILFWAGEYDSERQTPNLSLPSEWTLGWYTKRGMSWTQFIHNLQLRVLFQPQPKVILIHLGGNDLCSLSLLRIFNLVRRGIGYISSAYPEAHFLWVDILQRLFWTDSYKEDVIIERKRRRVNRFGRLIVRALPHGYSLVHDIDIRTPGFYRPDGTHLSNIGLAMYLDATRDILLHIISNI